MSSLNEFGNKKITHLWPIALLRIYTGVFFLTHGYSKVTREGGFADGLAGFVNSQLENSFGFFRSFLESVVLPNKALFGALVSWGELLVGLALIVGLATRYASIAGTIMVAAFWFTKGQGLLAGQNHDVIWFVIFVVLAAVHAGRTYGLDMKLSDRFRFLA